MKWIGKAAGYGLSLLLLVGLAFSSGVFSVLLYGKLTGKEWAISYDVRRFVFAEGADASPVPTPAPVPTPEPAPVPTSAQLDAPLVLQNPELPSGCEITSLTMLLQFAGIAKDKMELVPEIRKDETPLKWNPDGTIQSWGNPHAGYVGDMTGKSKGFGVYHEPVFDLLKSYVPTAVDLTGGDFEQVERQVAAGIPVVAWTTIGYGKPSRWVEWESPDGLVRTTFSEHAVLVVGFDEKNVYVNDPLKANKSVKIDKTLFVETWSIMGKQAVSYNKP